jgi:membrane fusion protein, multidrug efflux system
LPLTILAIIALASCGGSSPQPNAGKAAGTPTSVRAVAPETALWPSLYEATGTVQARTTATLAAKLMGYVREVRVQAGDSVREGQLLVTIDSRDLDAQLQAADAGRSEASSALPEVENAMASAQAQLELAQVTFRRMNDLFEKKSISPQEFDEANAKLKMAQANHEMAVARRAQLQSRIRQAGAAYSSAEVIRSYAELRAPFNGVVTEKRVDPGSMTAPGAPLLTIEQTGSYRLEVSVGEAHLGRIRVGQPVTVVLDALGQEVTARITEIVPAVDAASRAFTVKIGLPAMSHLRSGLFGRARFPVGSREVLAIPEDAIRERGQLQSVMVVSNNTARNRMVTTGQRSGGMVEVLSGLSPDERIIHPQAAALSDGSPVEVRQ